MHQYKSQNISKNSNSNKKDIDEYRETWKRKGWYIVIDFKLNTLADLIKKNCLST